MINILIAFAMMVFAMICSFGGLWLGAYIHHRGVSIGSGNKESFTGRVPEGEVFRVKDIDDLPNEPEMEGLKETQEQLQTISERASRFLKSAGING